MLRVDCIKGLDVGAQYWVVFGLGAAVGPLADRASRRQHWLQTCSKTLVMSIQTAAVASFLLKLGPGWLFLSSAILVLSLQELRHWFWGACTNFCHMITTLKSPHGLWRLPALHWVKLRLRMVFRFLFSKTKWRLFIALCGRRNRTHSGSCCRCWCRYICNATEKSFLDGPSGIKWI